MKISIFGLGYVGAVSCGCLAKEGHEIVGCDVSKTKVDMINAGQTPVARPKAPKRPRSRASVSMVENASRWWKEQKSGRNSKN